MKFAHKSSLFLLVTLLSVVATNFFALRYFSEKYFREYVAEVRRELPDINLDLVGAVIGAKGLDQKTIDEYRDTLRDLSSISSGLERFSQDPRSFIPASYSGVFESSGTDILSDPVARSFALSAETPVLSKILSFRAFGAETPEGIFAYKVLRSMFFVNFALIALVLLASSVFIRLSMRPLRSVVERIEGMANRHEYHSVEYSGNDEFRPLLDAIASLSESLAFQEKIRSDFLSDLSHEIKTPVTAIKCYLEGIEDGVIPLDEKNIRHLSEEIARLIRITDSVMKLERLEGKGITEIRPERIDLVETFERVRDEYLPMFAGTRQIVAFPDDKRFFIQFDRDGLLQIVHNVFSNFRKYAGPGSLLSIRFFHTKNDTVIIFTDDGPGVPESEVPFLREKFYQAEKSRTNEPGRGSGIGLSVVEKIVRLHSGALFVRSGEGKGFSLEIRIPKA
ncbi:MAG: Histidine kinase protein [Patescibacteria group bacterium]|nr:Histidine kinase protein [Patescibacteria group bacterium]